MGTDRGSFRPIGWQWWVSLLVVGASALIILWSRETQEPLEPVALTELQDLLGVSSLEKTERVRTCLVTLDKDKPSLCVRVDVKQSQLDEILEDSWILTATRELFDRGGGFVDVSMPWFDVVPFHQDDEVYKPGEGSPQPPAWRVMIRRSDDRVSLYFSSRATGSLSPILYDHLTRYTYEKEFVLGPGGMVWAREWP